MRELEWTVYYFGEYLRYVYYDLVIYRVGITVLIFVYFVVFWFNCLRESLSGGLVII